MDHIYISPIVHDNDANSCDCRSHLAYRWAHCLNRIIYENIKGEKNVGTYVSGDEIEKPYNADIK